MNLKIISLNINGLRHKAEFIEKHFKNIDIICLQESKLNNLLIKQKLFKNFNEYHFIDPHTLGQYGVSILYNHKIILKHLNEIIINDNFGRIALMEFIFNNHNITLINIYAHHISDITNSYKIKQKIAFYKKLITLVNKYKHTNLIILGDFNANKDKTNDFICNTYKNTPPGFFDIELKIYNQFLDKTNLINLYNFTGTYSYYSQRTRQKYIMFKHNKGLTVDAIMINNKFKNIIKKYHFEILKKFYTLSDHLPLYLEVSI
jgi:exodeoxyribonuclease III